VLQGMMMMDLNGVKDPKGKNEKPQNFPLMLNVSVVLFCYVTVLAATVLFT